ncbi:MAG: catechol 2,3-dioxygenase-like lactoylglutathione lyase family enzyme [Pseudohongiellaceae bacterium]|jgi:catechol 2,3-dioxygenase-like lactoylglutathione lyase family enzyme
MLVNDYDEALALYIDKLGFELVEDTSLADERKCWLIIAPSGSRSVNPLLAKASGEAQLKLIRRGEKSTPVAKSN